MKTVEISHNYSYSMRCLACNKPLTSDDIDYCPSCVEESNACNADLLDEDENSIEDMEEIIFDF